MRNQRNNNQLPSYITEVPDITEMPTYTPTPVPQSGGILPSYRGGGISNISGAISGMSINQPQQPCEEKIPLLIKIKKTGQIINTNTGDIINKETGKPTGQSTSQIIPGKQPSSGGGGSQSSTTGGGGTQPSSGNVSQNKYEKFLEFTSTRRDRNRYPFPADFEMSLAPQKQTAETALDPVYLSTPRFAWTSNLFNINTPTDNFVEGYVESNNPTAPPTTGLLSATTDNLTLILRAEDTGAGAQNFQQIKDYYVGACITITNTGLVPNVSMTRRIVSYKYMGTDGTYDRCIITIQPPPFPDSLLIEQYAYGNNCTFTISDPTDVSDPNFAQIFVPCGLPQYNAYTDFLLYNETQDNYVNVLYYDAVTHIITIKNTSGEGITNPITSIWTVADSFNVRLQFPYFTDATSGPDTLNSITITGGSNTNDAYKNYYIRILPESTGYTTNTYIYKNIPFNPYYSQLSKIISYNGTTKVAILTPSLNFVPVAGTKFEILQFSYDNLFPFNYTGKEKEISDYRVDLINLILPNTILNTGYGGRIAHYPYVYVKISNVGATSGGTRNLIMSNNPNSNSMMFRCPVNDINNPNRSPFIKLDGNGMSQVFKFTPADVLQFQVILPNGELFKTVIQDYYSPNQPNYEVQISAVFRLLNI